MKRRVGSRNHLKLPRLLSLGTGNARLENDERSEREADRAGDGVGYSFRRRLQMEKARKTGGKTGEMGTGTGLRWRPDAPYSSQLLEWRRRAVPPATLSSLLVAFSLRTSPTSSAMNLQPLISSIFLCSASVPFAAGNVTRASRPPHGDRNKQPVIE